MYVYPIWTNYCALIGPLWTPIHTKYCNTSANKRLKNLIRKRKRFKQEIKTHTYISKRTTKQKW